MKWQTFLVLALGLAGTPLAFAADPVTDAMTAAYAPYRAALFKTNSKAQAESEQAIIQAREAWRALAASFAAQVPPPYARDAQFSRTLADVAAVYEQAAAQIRDGKLAEAHETLEKVRDLLSELRHRNQVITYSDHMNAYHAEMEHLLGHGAAWVDQAQGFSLLMEKIGVMQFLAARLKSEAPAAVSADPAFTPALTSVEKSLAALREAVLAQDARKVRELLPRLKGPYGQLFLKFG